MGRPNPRLAARPTIRRDSMLFWRAYSDLSDLREYNSAGLQPISVSTIYDYMKIMGIRPGEPGMKFYRLMRKMDSAHREWYSQRDNRTTSKP